MDATDKDLLINGLKRQQIEKPNDANSEITMNSLMNENRFDDEVKRKDALIQQEALDSLNLAAYTSEADAERDEVLETTTEVIKFNLNGEENKYIVKKEVQAFIVDSDQIDVTYPIAG